MQEDKAAPFRVKRNTLHFYDLTYVVSFIDNTFVTNLLIT